MINQDTFSRYKNSQLNFLFFWSIQFHEISILHVLNFEQKTLFRVVHNTKFQNNAPFKNAHFLAHLAKFFIILRSGKK